MYFVVVVVVLSFSCTIKDFYLISSFFKLCHLLYALIVMSFKSQRLSLDPFITLKNSKKKQSVTHASKGLY